jgi:hypothetical protein
VIPCTRDVLLEARRRPGGRSASNFEIPYTS